MLYSTAYEMAAGQFLCEPLPDGYDDMTDDEFNGWLEHYRVEQFEDWSGDILAVLIDEVASKIWEGYKIGRGLDGKAH